MLKNIAQFFAGLFSTFTRKIEKTIKFYAKIFREVKKEERPNTKKVISSFYKITVKLFLGTVFLHLAILNIASLKASSAYFNVSLDDIKGVFSFITRFFL